LFTNGFVHPHVNRHLLQRTLPFLSCLSILSDGMSDDGSLIPLDDFELLTYAHIYQALPVFVLTFPKKTRTLSVQKFLENINFQNKMLDQVIRMMIDKGYRGLALNFTNIAKNTFDAYKSFWENLRIRLQNHGLFLHATLPLKREGNPLGLHSDQHNYHEISALCDHTSLMTYEWGYTYVHTSALNLK
jgi:spore germination protein